MSVSSLNAVLIDSRDAKRLVAFYRGQLGLSLREESHGSVSHRGCFLAGVHFAIHEQRTAAHGSPVAISFGVDNVDRLVDDLRRGGVTIAEEPVDRPFGRLAAVRDPDGNLVYLHMVAKRA